MSWPVLVAAWVGGAVILGALWVWATRGHRRREREAELASEWQGRIVTFRQGPRPPHGGRAGDPW